MSQISYTGAFNAATLQVADLYLNVLTADTGSISAANFGYVGLVGVASWGPVNKALQIGSAADLNTFGNPTIRAADIVTHAGIIMQAQQTAGIGYKLYCVRVTDGTDTAATGTIGGVTLTSRYTGTLGNTLQATLAAGSTSTSGNPTWTLTLQQGQRSEVYPNIAGSGATLWAAIVAAINSGQNTQRGHSDLVTAAATPSYTTPAAAATSTLSGGTDGAGSVTSSMFVGVDGTTESGIYALRGLGLSIGLIADFSDDTHLTDLLNFGTSEGIYMIAAGTSGETAAQAVAAKNGAGLDLRWVKRMVGDWVYANDNYNGVQRLMAPSTFCAAMLSTLQPNQSGLNKLATGVVATQKSRSGNPYSVPDLANLTGAGLDVLCKPIPYGNVFGFRTGLNGSLNNSVNGDNYNLMTSFLARSIAGAAAVGGLIGAVITDQFFQDGFALFDAFLSGLKASNLIDNYSVSFDAKNTTQAQENQGIVVANLQIKYQGIARIFLVNMTGGQTVVVTPAVAAGLAA